MVSRANGSNEEPAYNDLQWQVLKEKRTNAGGANNAVAYHSEYDPIDTGWLDHNEVAELFYMRRMFVGQVHLDDSVTATAVGSADINASLEINSGEAEWMATDQRAAQESRRFNQNLDHIQVLVDEGFKDSTNGVGAGSGDSAETHEREALFAGQQGMFKNGPVLDSNDSLDIRGEIAKFQMAHNAEFRVYWVLGWKTHELENIRDPYGL